MARWLAVAIVLALSLAACSGFPNSNRNLNEHEKYYTGTQGVTARFVDVPSTVYYYGPDDTAGSNVDFSVELKNEGASYTRGGVYVSGFDPHMLKFQEIPIGPAQEPCGLSLGNIGLGQIIGTFHCGGLTVSGAEGEGLTQVIWDKPWMDENRFNANFNWDRSSGQLTIGFDNVLGNIEYYQNGRLFIYALARFIDFRLNNGREFLLAADNYEYPGGESDYLLYHGIVADWPPGLDETTQSLLLTTCYQYTTYADPVVCVDPSPMSDNAKVCYPQSRTWNGGNGAPVAITSVEQENTPKKIIFHINVRNVGGGTVWDPGKLDKCSPYQPERVTPDDKNVVYLGDVRVGSYGLAGRGGQPGITCYPEVIRLDPRTGTGTTTCTYELQYANLKSAYQTPLTVELWYGYSQVYRQNIRIKRVI